MTQHDRILSYLEEKGSVTVLEAAIHMKITKLPTRIGELQRKGWIFPSHWEGSGATRYKRYYTPRKVA